MRIQIPFNLTVDDNKMVYDHLEAFHAHSDLSELLVETVKGLDCVKVYFPERPNGYGPCIVSTGGIIFGFAIGLDTIVFKVGRHMIDKAIAAGGRPYSECGADWVSFLAFRSDRLHVDFKSWALSAYVFVRESCG